MKLNRSAPRGIVILLLLAPLAVMSTPPSISWDVFDVNGIVAGAGGSPADHTVVLVRRDYCGGVEQWCRLANCNVEEAADYGPYTPVALTKEDGSFYLRIAVCGYTDTLAVAVVYPDTMLVGDPFAPADFQSTPITRIGHYEDQGFFCDNDEEFEYEVGRIYRIPDAIVSVP